MHSVGTYHLRRTAMEFDRLLSSDITLPCLAPDRAAWTVRSRAAVGRRTSSRGRVEVALGSGAVELGSRRGTTVDCYLADLSDEKMAELAAIERSGTPLPDLAKGMEWLAKAGLSMHQAAQVLGLPGRAEASRLNAIASMGDDVLVAMAKLGLTRNHARWLLGLSDSEALSALADLTKHRAEDDSRNLRSTCSLSVADIRNWRQRRATGPSHPPALLAACVSESARLSDVLATRVVIAPGDEAGHRTMRLAFGSVDALAGVFEKLGVGHGDAPPPLPGHLMRWAVIEPINDAELAYLAGTADS